MSLRATILIGALAAVACGGQSEVGGAPDGSAGSGGVSGSGGSGATGGLDAAVDSNPPDVTPPAGQNILFEVYYENYAWQPSLNGVFITADGSIYKYDYFANAADAAPPTVIYPATEAELRARYGSNPVKTGSVPVSELTAHYAEVPGAANGVLLRQFLCADAGEITSVGYLFDPATARYSPVILGMDGDQAGLNLAPGAAGLVAWLAQYSTFLGGSCKFAGVACTGAACNSPPPSCPNGQVPSVVNGCWSDCVTPDRCLAVDDCSQCPGGMACATAQDGSRHCLQSYCQSTDVCSCPFTPACAGGQDYCTNLGPMQVRCGG